MYEEKSWDIDPHRFVYFRHPTLSSMLWTLWLHTPSFVRSKIYQALIFFGHKTTSPNVTRLPFFLYAKHGEWITVTEALATQYVSLNTTIPVPTILDVVLDTTNRSPIILMTRVPGKPLGRMPQNNADKFSEEQLAIFASVLRGWFSQLRRLEPPDSQGPSTVCGFLGTPFTSFRIKHTEYVGPFNSVVEFHSQHYCTLPPLQADADICNLQNRMHQKLYRLCFTHGDISPTNILVDDNYVPVGLVDFGCAAWLPEYWELTSSIYIRVRYMGWVRIMKEAIPHDYEDELAVEKEMWKFIMPW